MSFSYASVIETTQLSPRIRRVRLHVEDPAALAVQPGGDSAVGVYFDGTPGSEGRNYSVRRHDGDTIDLDVVLHARGVGTTWANTTVPGERVGLGHARSWYAPDPTADWQLLVADLAGLPALARIVTESDAQARILAIVEVVDESDLEYLSAPHHVTLVPAVGTGNGHSISRLSELVAQQDLPPGRGYCWFAGEASESRAVRKHVRGLGWSTEQFDVVGYWRLDSEAWDRKFEAVGDDLVAVYTKALADGKGDKIASEEFDEALERAGL